MARTKRMTAVSVAVALVVAVVAVIAVVAAYRAYSSGQGLARGARYARRARDVGSGRSKCYSCEADAGVQGTVTKCLDCQGPSFRYLSETIIAERGAAENGACLGCRGAP